MPKCRLIMKMAVQNAGCVFAYFFGGHKNNFRLQFRSSFKYQNDIVIRNEKQNKMYQTIQITQGIIE